jgi:uncharacterized membrane protein (UPF0127 family)
VIGATLKRCAGVLAAVIVTAGLLPSPGRAATEPLFQFPQRVLALRSPTGHVAHVDIWIADTPARQEQGLMFVRDLDEHRGMLFTFPGLQRTSMWMKNTYIPLDMLFLDGQGRIDYIVPNTTPQSLDLIQPPRPILSVLELKGGAAQRLGIHVGDVASLQQIPSNKP